MEVFETNSPADVGLKDELVGVPYSGGDNSVYAHLNTTYYHVHGKSFVFPNHANDVTLTSGALVWNLTGAITEVIGTADLLAYDFDLHWINISNISTNCTLQIDIYGGEAGSEVLIGATRASRTTNQARNGPSRIQIPQQEENTRISCRISDSTAGAITANVSFEGHYYGVI